MDPPDTLTRRVLIEGYVQGVGFRAFACRVAPRHRISGWVRNRRDGLVEALISGTPDKVEAMLAELGGGLRRPCPQRSTDRAGRRRMDGRRFRPPRDRVDRVG